MGIKMTTPKQAVNSLIEAKRKACEAILLRELNYIGEQCVNTARERFKSGKQYKDRTGNLTSSMGYIIVKGGKILSKSAFEKVKSTATKGHSSGESYAKQLVSEVHSQNYTLIVVAGMKYAVCVQAKGYDVLDSAEIKAGKLIEESKQAIGNTLQALGL